MLLTTDPVISYQNNGYKYNFKDTFKMLFTNSFRVDTAPDESKMTNISFRYIISEVG